MGIDLNDWIWKYPKGHVRHHIYRWYCDVCGASLGYKNKSNTTGLCRRCCHIKSSDNKTLPEWVDADDWIWKQEAPAIRRKYYRTRCAVCGKDRGYLVPLSGREKPICNSCAHARRKEECAKRRAVKKWQHQVEVQARRADKKAAQEEERKKKEAAKGKDTRKRTIRGLYRHTTTVEYVAALREKYGEELVGFDRVLYTNDSRCVELYCFKCGEYFTRKAGPLLRTKGKIPCLTCYKKSAAERQKKDKVDFIREVEELQGKGLFIFNKVEYVNNRTPVILTCTRCGIEFEKKPRNLLYGVWTGCPNCDTHKSRAEARIKKWLKATGMVYLFDYRFEDCISTRPLPFDFYLPEHAVCIEYDGEQHFRSVEYFGGVTAFKKRQLNDNIKNDYCNKKHIELVRVSYKDYDRLEEILTEKFINLGALVKPTGT